MPGGSLRDTESDPVFFGALAAGVPETVEVVRVVTHAQAPEYVEVCVDRLTAQYEADTSPRNPSMSSLPTIPKATLERLIHSGTAAWDEFGLLASDRFHLFIPCDHLGAYEELRKLRSRATNFVEFGSAAGIVTIMADLLGYEAHGIEIEPWLVDRSAEIAAEFGSKAVFAEGSFVVPEYQDEIELLSSDSHNPTGGANAFDELGLDLDDYDLIFAYPWPGDEEWLYELVRRHARPEALLLTYDVTEGFRVTQAG